MLRNDEVGIEMESGHIVAEEKSAALPKSSEVEFRGWALIDAANVTHGNSGTQGIIGFALNQNTLCPQENFTSMDFLVSAPAVAAVDIRLGQHQELQPGDNGQFRYLVDADTGAEFRRRDGSETARLELKVADGG